MAKQLLQNRLKLAEYVRNVYGATPEPGITLDDMVRPEYWAHVARTLRPGDRIEVCPDDRSWFAELFVVSQSDTDVRVAVLRSTKIELPEVKPLVQRSAPKPGQKDDSSYEVKHRGAAGWSVVRKVDKAVVFEGGQSRRAAEDWLEANAEMA